MTKEERNYTKLVTQEIIWKNIEHGQNETKKGKFKILTAWFYTGTCIILRESKYWKFGNKTWQFNYRNMYIEWINKNVCERNPFGKIKYFDKSTFAKTWNKITKLCAQYRWKTKWEEATLNIL